MPSSPGATLDARALALRSVRSLGPWTSDHLAALLVANLVGIVAMAVGWWVTHRSTDPSDQIAWSNLAIVGLAFAGAADGLWLARGRQAVRRAREVTVARIPEVIGDPAQLPVPPGALDRAAANGNGHGPVDGSLVAIAGMARFHRADCLLVAGKPVTAADRAAHERAGRRPCEVCSA
jgi:hypothetical protein